MSGVSPLLRYRSPRGRARAPALAVAVALALLLLIVPVRVTAASSVSAPPAAHPWTQLPGTGFGIWTNGVVQLVFPARTPSMTISSVADPRVSTTLDIAGLAEVMPNGYFAAFAPFSAANTTWQFPWSTSGGTLDLAFTTTAEVVSAAGDWEAGDDGSPNGTLGNATFRVDVFLNDSVPATTNSARISVNATGWPWVNSSDSLGLDLALVAAKGTRIAPSVGPTPYLLQELANTSNAPVASLSWAPAATVLYGDGSTDSTTVATYSSTSPDGANSTVHLLFGSVAGNYSSISYDPWIALNLGAFLPVNLPAWALDLGGWVTLAAAAALVAVLAVASARRRRPTDDEL